MGRIPPFPRVRARSAPRPQLSPGGEAGSVPAHPRVGSALSEPCCPFAHLRDSWENRESPGSSEELIWFSSDYCRTPSPYQGLYYRKLFSFEERVFRFFFDFPPAFSLSLFAKFACKPAMILTTSPAQRKGCRCFCPRISTPLLPPPQHRSGHPGTPLRAGDGTGGTRTC